MKIYELAEGKVHTDLMHICMFTSPLKQMARKMEDYELLGDFGAALNFGNAECHSHTTAMAIFEEKKDDPAYIAAQRRLKESRRRGGKKSRRADTVTVPSQCPCKRCEKDIPKVGQVKV